MTLNGKAYSYERDMQGDITGLLDSNNNEVVTYTYDSWGKLLNIGGSLADTVGKENPLRYRGYYYDTETGLYYLQSRYYNSELGRFISRDDESYHDGDVSAAANTYAYGNNNPVVNSDPTGQSVTSMILNIASSVFSLVLAVNPATGGWKMGFALMLGAISLGVTLYDYYASLKDLKNDFKKNRISIAEYNRDIKLCNFWLKIGIAVAVITTVFTYLGLPKFNSLMSRTSMVVLNALVTVFLGHTLSNVMWINDMVSLSKGKVQWL